MKNCYTQIVEIIKSGKFGKPQVLNCSVNVQENETDCAEIILELIAFCDCVMNATVDKEHRELEKKPYTHGFVSREYVDGGIARLSFTVTPIADVVNINVFLSDGELRFNSKTDKLVTFIQSPDYKGDEF